MPLKAGQRIAAVQGRAGAFRVIQQARRNSRVVLVDLVTGEEMAESELVATEFLHDIRTYKPETAVARTIRITNALHERLIREARTFETPSDVLERLLPPEGKHSPKPLHNDHSA